MWGEDNKIDNNFDQKPFFRCAGWPSFALGALSFRVTYCMLCISILYWDLITITSIST